MKKQFLASTAVLCLATFACERDPVVPQESPTTVAPPATPLDPTQRAERPDEPKRQEKREAEAEFKATSGLSLKGEAEFKETPEGVRIEVEVKDAPIGMKGIHIHEKGDCSNIPGKSMGEHFAPTDKDHGLPAADKKHLGDLGNIEVNDKGEGKLEIVVAKANLIPGDPLSFLGKSIVIHTAEDVGTGESGQSGQPIACAVINKD